MKIVRPSYTLDFLTPESGITQQQLIEKAARTCYLSEDKIEDGSDTRLIRSIVKRRHHAMLEFGYVVAFITADRGFSHELVRHRLASFAQESTRYCNYSKGKFGSEITVLEQPGWPSDQAELRWKGHMQDCESAYVDLSALGCNAGLSRSVLPISLKANIVVGANTREWRHIFKMRCDKASHPTMRAIMIPMFMDFLNRMPNVYEDLAENFLS